MSKWINRLDLIDLWERRNKKELSLIEVSIEVAKRIRHLKCYKEQEDVLEEIALNFESVDENVEEFDNILDDLYDWGDTPLDNKFGGKKMCWIATSF